MPDYPHKEELIYDKVISTAAQTTTQVVSDLIDLATHIALSKPEQVRASVSMDSPDRLAEHDLFDAKEMLKEGMNPEDIKIEISHSRVSQECDRPDVYQNCIVSLADRENILEDSPPLEVSVEHSQDLQL